MGDRTDNPLSALDRLRAVGASLPARFYRGVVLRLFPDLIWRISGVALPHRTTNIAMGIDHLSRDRKAFASATVACLHPSHEFPASAAAVSQLGGGNGGRHR